MHMFKKALTFTRTTGRLCNASLFNKSASSHRAGYPRVQGGGCCSTWNAIQAGEGYLFAPIKEGQGCFMCWNAYFANSNQLKTFFHRFSMKREMYMQNLRPDWLYLHEGKCRNAFFYFSAPKGVCMDICISQVFNILPQNPCFLFLVTTEMYFWVLKGAQHATAGYDRSREHSCWLQEMILEQERRALEQTCGSGRLMVCK